MSRSSGQVYDQNCLRGIVGDPDGPWVWSGRVLVEFRNDTTRLEQRQRLAGVRQCNLDRPRVDPADSVGRSGSPTVWWNLDVTVIGRDDEVDDVVERFTSQMHGKRDTIERRLAAFIPHLQLPHRNVYSAEYT